MIQKLIEGIKKEYEIITLSILATSILGVIYGYITNNITLFTAGLGTMIATYIATILYASWRDQDFTIPI